MPDLGSVLGTLGGLRVGGVLGQYLASGKDRRAARAGVLQALALTEAARWHPNNASDLSFHAAARQLETAALIAQVPRSAVEEYLVLTQAASWLSADSAAAGGVDDEGSGGIISEFADVVRDAARHLSRVVWAPTLVARWRARRGAPRRTAKLNALQDADALRQLQRTHKYGF